MSADRPPCLIPPPPLFFLVNNCKYNSKIDPKNSKSRKHSNIDTYKTFVKH